MDDITVCPDEVEHDWEPIGVMGQFVTEVCRRCGVGSISKTVKEEAHYKIGDVMCARDLAIEIGFLPEGEE